MPMWRCPHCGVPQLETARCWVCHRSTTACATCRHFRRSVAAQLGYCGLDRQRRPIRGDEIRWCWEPATPTQDPGDGDVAVAGERAGIPAPHLPRSRPADAGATDRDLAGRSAAPRLEFVEVPTRPAPLGSAAAVMDVATSAAPSVPPDGVDGSSTTPDPMELPIPTPGDAGWILWSDLAD